MTRPLHFHAVCALLASTAIGTPAFAASSTASMASDSLATSVGSLSGSIEKSSRGSSKATGVAEGDYKVIEVATVEARPGMVRMTLQPLATGTDDPDNEFHLFLPQAIARQAGVARGDTVAARQRPYGVEFAQGQPRQAFFLVLSDAWFKELQTTAVAL